MELWEALSSYRRTIGMTITELSKRTKIPENTLKKILTGVVEKPSFEKVREIVYAMGLTLDELDCKLVEADYNSLSPKALLIARAYDDISEYGKTIIDTIIKFEENNSFKIVPVYDAYLDGTAETKFARLQEMSEVDTQAEAALTNEPNE